MLINTLKSIFERDLLKLKSEIKSYSLESDLWLVDRSISNSAGNLSMHLIGNLNHFVGAQLGSTGYVRNRDFEFSGKNIPKQTLLQQIDDTISMLHATLDGLSESQLQEDYPKIVFREKMSVEFFLVHLTTHLAYHLGQINYHRRLLDK